MGLRKIRLYYRERPFFDEPRAIVLEEYDEIENGEQRTISLEKSFNSLTEAIRCIEKIRDKWKVDGNES